MPTGPDWALGSLGLIDRLIDRDGPQWMPKFAANFVGDKIYKGAGGVHREGGRRPTARGSGSPSGRDQPVRQTTCSTTLETIAKFEALKTELVGRDEG